MVPVFAFNPKELAFYGRIWSNIDTSEGGPHWLQRHQSKFQKDVHITLSNKFFIVPKPSANLDSEWRLDFHDPEIKIIDNIGCAKPVIKFLKVPIQYLLFTYYFRAFVIGGVGGAKASPDFGSSVNPIFDLDTFSYIFCQ